MTQVIAARHQDGIVVATDSRAVRPGAQGAARTLTVQKLFALGTHAFVLSAGSGLGIPLSHRLQAFTQARGIREAEDILGFAGAFLNQHYRQILSQGAPQPQADLPTSLYFLIGGAGRGDRHGTHRLIFLASEEGELALAQHEITHCLTIPRSLGTERRLHLLCQAGTPLLDILEFAHEFLIRRTEDEEGVGPPYLWALLTSAGLRLGRWSEGSRSEPPAEAP